MGLMMAVFAPLMGLGVLVVGPFAVIYAFLEPYINLIQNLIG